MPETIEDRGSGPKWHWDNVKKDLVEQGGLEAATLTINPISVKPGGCSGQYGDNLFHITWMHNVGLLVTARDFSQELIDAFERVVGYKPLARYREPDTGLVTTEWNKTYPEDIWKTLQEEGKFDLTRLS